ncbi:MULTISPECIES: class II aldolase/adducin family protein [Streptomyces]|nr:class II aldolase/adducin family protein [Streptomyces ruber]
MAACLTSTLDSEGVVVLERLPFPFRAVLLQNHGPVTAGTSLRAAVEAAVEVEEVSALPLLLGENPVRLLTPEEAAAPSEKYGSYGTGPTEGADRRGADG